jgi:hypothetical protein
MVGAEGPGLPVFLLPNRMKDADLRTDVITVWNRVSGSDFNSPPTIKPPSLSFSGTVGCCLSMARQPLLGRRH